MNWFASSVFKADWFAARWFTNVTVPIITGMGGSGGGGSWVYPQIKIYRVRMPGLFAGAAPGQPTPTITETIWADDIFAIPSRRNPPPTRGPRRPARGPEPVRGLVRNLDVTMTLRASRPGYATECSCAGARYPLRMRDAYGTFDVLAVYCNRRDESGMVVVRHLG